MRAVDTNLIVRIFAKDDAEQTARAVAFIDAGDVWIPMSVILEAEWVLRSAYRAAPQKICRLLRSLLGLPGLHVENAEDVSQALDWFEQGMDFADALHLASARHCERLATFDRDFIRAAARIGAGNVAEP
jgi:predicted nucleic-acid-binding protein